MPFPQRHTPSLVFRRRALSARLKFPVEYRALGRGEGGDRMGQGGEWRSLTPPGDSTQPISLAGGGGALDEVSEGSGGETCAYCGRDELRPGFAARPLCRQSAISRDLVRLLRLTEKNMMGVGETLNIKILPRKPVRVKRGEHAVEPECKKNVGKQEIPEKTLRSVASSGPTPCENTEATPPEIESGSPWWEASHLFSASPQSPWSSGPRKHSILVLAFANLLPHPANTSPVGRDYCTVFFRCLVAKRYVERIVKGGHGDTWLTVICKIPTEPYFSLAYRPHFLGKRDWGRNGKVSAMAFLRDPSQHSPGVISRKSWEIETRMAGPAIDPGSTRMRVQAGLEIEMKFHFEQPKLVVRNFDPRSAAIVDKCSLKIRQQIELQWRRKLRVELALFVLVNRSQREYVNTRKFFNGVGSFDLGSEKMLVRPGIEELWRGVRTIEFLTNWRERSYLEAGLVAAVQLMHVRRGGRGETLLRCFSLLRCGFKMQWHGTTRCATLTNPAGWQTWCGKENLKFGQRSQYGGGGGRLYYTQCMRLAVIWRHLHAAALVESICKAPTMNLNVGNTATHLLLAHDVAVLNYTDPWRRSRQAARLPPRRIGLDPRQGRREYSCLGNVARVTIGQDLLFLDTPVSLPCDCTISTSRDLHRRELVFPKRRHLARKHKTEFLSSLYVTCRLDSTVLCINTPMPSAYWLSAVTVEGNDWVIALQEMSSTGLELSLPTNMKRFRFPAGSLPDFLKLESLWTMPLVDGFSRGSPVSPAFAFKRYAILTSFHPHRRTKLQVTVHLANYGHRPKICLAHFGELLGGPGLIPGGVTPRFSHVGIVQQDAAGPAGFLGVLPFTPSLHSGAAPYSPPLTIIGSRDLDFKRSPNFSTDKIDVKPVYTKVDFAIGSQFIRHARDDSEPIAHLQGNK
ncbi:hypothetical protein PR048_018970 [Dryococelus australis]|uniref:Uncharacterized protein n=1 Tax=Dryococelus australis TaxID=614101 RepID=A0ABQ9H2A9_9NEOP|nr:hypothetical protein PR048_018970 [Dryococelus australis]